ncbi:MAG: hypothetical protein QOH41_2802 [Blastocatellia bacterium]|nr:hypothetical protein [Blastocatellia bacterium]
MTQPTLAKFTLDTSDGETIPLLGGAELEVIDDIGDGHVIAECDQAALANASLEAFPAALTLQVQSTDGFGTFLFHEAEIYRNDSGDLMAEHICHQPNKYWEGTWGLATFLGAIRDQLPFFADVTLGNIELEDDWKRLTLQIPLADGPAAEVLQASADILKKIIREAEIALGGIGWKPEYAKDERAFCEEVVAPLLRRMRFLSVRYTQGAREYGKDFTFSELTPFGVLRHYGLQAKAGDVSGEVNSAIDELVGQADDAFKMPYYDIASTEPRYISTFIIAISGRFTSNAKEKIVHKVPRGVHGSLLFLDRESIFELVDRYWKTA